MSNIQKNQCHVCQKAFASPSGLWYHRQKDRKCYPVAPHVNMRSRKKKKQQGGGSVVARPMKKMRKAATKLIPGGNLNHLVAMRDILNPLRIHVYNLAVDEDIQYCLNLSVDECVNGASSFTWWDLPEAVDDQNFKNEGVLAGVHMPRV